MISFLNTNQGAVMATLTLIYVVATIVIVWFNKKAIDEMKLSREGEARPYLFCHLSFIARETKRGTLVLKNYGKTGATITSFLITPRIPLPKGESNCSFFKGTTIAPQQSITLLAYDEELQMQSTKYQVSITYQDVSTKVIYKENYDLTQQYISESTFFEKNGTRSSKAENALISISDSLDTIKNLLQ